jgi:ferrous iron transport protein A
VNLFGFPRSRRQGSHPVHCTAHSSADARAATLADQAVGSRVVLGASLLANPTTRRLGELGLRTGTEVVILHRTAGRGLVIAAGDTRIALDRATLAAWPVAEPPTAGQPRVDVSAARP